MEYTEIIERFGRDHGIDGLLPDEDGCCDFDVDNLPVHVFALPGTERLVVWGEVCPLPTHGVATFLYGDQKEDFIYLSVEDLEPGHEANLDAFKVKIRDELVNGRYCYTKKPGEKR